MSAALSSLVQQTLKQTVENQSVKQQAQTQNKTSFENHMQKDQNTQNPNQTSSSGVQLQGKMDQLQSDLTQRLQQANPIGNNFSDIPKELLDSKSRLSLLREANTKLGSSTLPGGFEGRLSQTENEYKQIDSLMKSDKNLSPGELLALQAKLYQVSQHIEVMSKVVDQMAGGIKTVLNTNV